MGIRRKGMWLGYGIAFVLYLFILFNSALRIETPEMTMKELWANAALLAFVFNTILPVIGGISAADRLIRDRNLHVYEVLQSSRLTTRDYLVGKYLGTLAAISLPVLVGIVVFRILAIFLGAPAVTFGMSLAAFLAVNLPAYVFITAFSLICPLVMPTRVYQILFTGYWFWGNFVYPEMIPTLSGTVLQVSGKIPAEGLFGAIIEMGIMKTFTFGEVWLNLAFIILSLVMVFVVATKFLSKEKTLA